MVDEKQECRIVGFTVYFDANIVPEGARKMSDSQRYFTFLVNDCQNHKGELHKYGKRAKKMPDS